MRQSATLTRAVTYGRSSSANEKSIADQNRENAEAAKAEGWTIVEELSDPVSASRYGTKIRKNWERLCELLPTVDVVVLWEPSRGDRTLATWAAWLDACREYGVKVHATSHRRTYDPRIPRDYRSLAEDGVDSAYESDKLSQRVRRGNDARVAAGKPLSTPAFGYLRVYDKATGAYEREVEHPKNGPIVREIFRAFAEGESLAAIVKWLHQDGIPTPMSDRRYRHGRTPVWRGSTVRKILMNRRYAPHPDDPERGTLVHRGGETTVPGTWPPLVSLDVWQAVQDRLGVDDEETRAARKWVKPGHVKHLLSGSADLLRAPCGGLVSADPGRHYSARYMCATDGCSSIAMTETDEYVTRLVVARLSAKDARRLWVADDAAMKAAAKELARLEAQLKQNEDAYRRGEISPRLAGAREQELLPLIEDARRRARPAGAPLAVLRLLDAAKFGAEHVRQEWDFLPVLAKREVVANLFSDLSYGPATTRLHAAMTLAERLDVVSARIQHQWRTAPAAANAR